MLRRFPPRSPFETDPAQIGDAIVTTAMAARFKSSSTGLMIEQANHVANWRTLSPQIASRVACGDTNRRLCHRAAMRGWPDDWSERKAGRDCALCATLGGGDNDYTVDVAELPWSQVGLERRSRLPGYCIVAWKGRHVAEPTVLDPDEAAGYWADVVAVGRAIEAEFHPAKLNFLTLGNWVPHLHTHVLPRYLDDPAAGGPIAWDAIFAAEPTDPEVLSRQAAALRARLIRG
jgi:diadenosine tetraphosphate (Ap4A) HIT family hydrolase